MASGRHKESSAAGEGFVRPLTDTLADIEREWDVNITMQLRPSGRRGVLEVVLSAYRLSDGVGARPCCRVSKDWPNAEVGSLPALLYNLSFKLGRLVEEDWKDAQAQVGLWPEAQARRRT